MWCSSLHCSKIQTKKQTHVNAIKQIRFDKSIEQIVERFYSTREIVLTWTISMFKILLILCSTAVNVPNLAECLGLSLLQSAAKTRSPPISWRVLMVPLCLTSHVLRTADSRWRKNVLRWMVATSIMPSIQRTFVGIQPDTKMAAERAGYLLAPSRSLAGCTIPSHGYNTWWSVWSALFLWLFISSMDSPYHTQHRLGKA